MTTALAEKTILETDPACRPDTRPGRKSIAPILPARDIIVPIPADFRLTSGEALADPVIRARLQGRPGAPLVIVAGGISSGRFVNRTETNGSGWWSGAVTAGGPIDLDRFQVLAFDFAPDGPTAPSTPLTVTTGDQARLLAVLLDHMETPRAAAFVGCSYGGMVGLAFAEAFPERLGQLVVISAAHRPHPLATAWRGVQRRILQLAVEAGRPEDGVALARELSMTTYRTPEELDARFDTVAPERAGGRYPVCDYLGARGRAYPAVMTASRWLTLSDSIDRHTVTPEAITVPATLIGFTSDRLVPIDDMRELAARLPNLFRLVEAPSLYGHDAFLKEDAFVADVLTTALKDIDQ
jgi:homoserine O-acetyltransferase/O-succinyltransferase